MDPQPTFTDFSPTDTAPIPLTRSNNGRLPKWTRDDYQGSRRRTLPLIAHSPFPRPGGGNTAMGFMTYPIMLALGRLTLGLIAGLVFDDWAVNQLGQVYHLNSGSYRLGALSARFVLKATARDDEGKLIAFKPETLKAAANALLAPFIEVRGTVGSLYVMSGEIVGPAVNGSGEIVPLGMWKLVVGPSASTVHDELWLRYCISSDRL
ncbi:MAG: hypothetical protein Q9170_005345 [Blastenia crenularia]